MVRTQVFFKKLSMINKKALLTWVKTRVWIWPNQPPLVRSQHMWKISKVKQILTSSWVINKKKGRKRIVNTQIWPRNNSIKWKLRVEKVEWVEISVSRHNHKILHGIRFFTCCLNGKKKIDSITNLRVNQIWILTSIWAEHTLIKMMPNNQLKTTFWEYRIKSWSLKRP